MRYGGFGLGLFCFLREGVGVEEHTLFCLRYEVFQGSDADDMNYRKTEKTTTITVTRIEKIYDDYHHYHRNHHQPHVLID